MKKAGIVLILFLTCFVFLPTRVFASDGRQEIWQDFTELLGNDENTTEEEIMKEAEPLSVISEVLSLILEEKTLVFGFFMLVFCLVLLICASESCELFPTSELSSHVGAGVTAIVGVVIFSAMYPFILSLKDSLASLNLFFSGLVPIVTGISLSSGSVNSAAAHAANMNLVFGLVSGVLTTLLLPIALLMFMLAVSDSLSVGNGASLAKSARSLFFWMLGIVTALIMGGVSMQSLISSASDSAYMRAAKFASSGLIPVVGGTVSGALGSLVGGLTYVKDCVGAGAVAFILVTSLSPLAILLLYRLAISLALLFMNFVGVSTGTLCFSATLSALDSVIAVFVSSVVVYLFEIIIFMRCGVASFG